MVRQESDAEPRGRSPLHRHHGSYGHGCLLVLIPRLNGESAQKRRPVWPRPDRLRPDTHKCAPTNRDPARLAAMDPSPTVGWLCRRRRFRAPRAGLALRKRRCPPVPRPTPLRWQWRPFHRASPVHRP